MATIYGIGRNYPAHAREMGAQAPVGEEPIVFLKPESALLAPPAPIVIPADAGEIHHEVELVLRIGADLGAEAVAVGLDLTDRTRQVRAKAGGLPWARAKGFRGSAPVGPFVGVGTLPPLGSLRFCLRVNGDLRQEGAARDMLHPPAALLGFLDRAFGLRPGDLVFTGTPDGVAALHPGDDVELELVGVPAAHSRWRVQRA